MAGSMHSGPCGTVPSNTRCPGTGFPTATHLASYAGLAPATKQSGTSIHGEHAPRGGNRQLERAMFLPAFAARHGPASRTYYDRYRDRGKTHTQALFRFVRHRISVLFAMLCDDTFYEPCVPRATAACTSPQAGRLTSTSCVVCPRQNLGSSPTDSRFRVPGELLAGRCDVRHTVRSRKRVMHPGLHPVSLVVVSLGNRESDEPYGGHRPHPGQGLCRLPGHRRVFDIQQQSHQHFRSFRNISKGSKVTPGTNTLRPRRRRRLSQGVLQPIRHLWHDQTVSCPTEKIEPRAEAAHTLDEEHRGPALGAPPAPPRPGGGAAPREPRHWRAGMTERRLRVRRS